GQEHHLRGRRRPLLSAQAFLRAVRNSKLYPKFGAASQFEDTRRGGIQQERIRYHHRLGRERGVGRRRGGEPSRERSTGQWERRKGRHYQGSGKRRSECRFSVES